jgi:transglutaminase-like putative cysteine protease
VLISVRHVTSYRYAEPVRYTIQCLRLTPVPFKGQRVVSWAVKAPGDDAPLRFTDGFGNPVHVVAINKPHGELVIEAGGIVETEDTNGVVAGIANPVPPRVFLRETPQTRADAAITELAKSAKRADALESLHELSRLVRDRVEYVPGTTDVHTEAAAALADGKGVCQDHTHIFIAGCRTLEVPARYVTGYLYLGDDAGAEAHHAWAEAWVDGLGWVGFDVANRICPTDNYVRLASGLDAGYAAPIKGSRRGGSGESLDVAVAVHQQQNSAQQ